MTNLKILASSKIKYFGDLHPFHKWNKQLREAGIHVEILYDHTNKSLFDAERVILHHRYFDSGWVNALNTATDVNGDFINYLSTLKASVGKLIWFDADDSSGTTQFPVIPFVDAFVKKQVLKDISYYTDDSDSKKNLMVWAHPGAELIQFIPCPENQAHKIKPGWNIAYNDYRNFVVHYRLRKYLSHFTNYNIFPLRYTQVTANRLFDITFRGTVKYDTYFSDIVSFQRRKVFEILNLAPYNILSGNIVHRDRYLSELNKTKVSISPFGYGEICYRDFETFISGSLLVKPSMDHLVTFPNLYLPNETYVPISWDLSDLRETLDKIITNYSLYKEIAINGQELYKKTIDDPDVFINAVYRIIN